MTVMSAAPGASTATITPPTSSHGASSAWKFNSHMDQQDVMQSHEQAYYDLNGTSRGAHSHQNGNAEYDPYSQDEYRPTRESYGNDEQPTAKRTGLDPSPMPTEQSQWIHRDKLAKIENEELQAAGIYLPKPRAHSRPRRDRSQDKVNGHSRRPTDASDQQSIPRSRKGSTQSDMPPLEPETPSWDLRLPEEIAEDPGEEYWVANDSGRGTRIPLAKLSPAPIPVDFLERDAPMSRKTSAFGLDDEYSTSLPKPRSRSSSSAFRLDDPPRTQAAKRAVVEGSPKKPAAGTTARKTSGTGKQPAATRPKTRSGSGPRSSSTTRPSTRGEMSASRAAPEGDPPWMISAYKPDPRLPPDQQLLPTVARRLQQEKWEQEGKFGNVYDTEFRPLNDEAALRPPELTKPKAAEERQDEWPLRADTKSPPPGSRPGTSSYSTMPKIQDKPNSTPLPSPRPPQQPQIQSTANVAVPEPAQDAPAEEEKKKRGGCGCCVVM